MNYAHPYSHAARIPYALVYTARVQRSRKNERRVSHLQIFVMEASATIYSAQSSPFSFFVLSAAGASVCVRAVATGSAACVGCFPRRG